MIPNEPCRNAKDAFDYNVIHGIALTFVRFNSDVTWSRVTYHDGFFANMDWSEVTEIQFADGSVWRLNQNHTPPIIVTKHTEIRS